MQTFADVIGAWPSNGDFGEDVGAPTSLVAVWRHRKTLPPQHWKKAVEGALRRGIEGVTLELLATIAADTDRSGDRKAG